MAGIIKAFVFCGLQELVVFVDCRPSPVQGSGEFPPTRSVVTSIFLIVLVDAVFAVIFFAIDF